MNIRPIRRTCFRFATAALLAVPLAFTARADYPSTVVSQGPVGYWRLNETVQPHAAITNASNLGSLGAAENGTYNGNQAFLRGFAGALASSDTAAQFDGTSQYVQVPYNASLNPAANFTIEAWLAPASTNVPGGLTCALACGHFASPRSGWLVYQSPLGWDLRMYNQNGLNPALNIIAATNMIAGDYYHLAITFNGTNANVYVNSVLLTNGSPTSYVPGTDGPFTIGIRSDNGFPWAGKADEVAFYPSVLSQSQIAAHYSAATTNATGYANQILASNPLIYFRLDEAGDPPAANLGTLGTNATGAYIEGSHPGAPGPVPPPLPGFEATNTCVSFDGTGGYAAVPGLNLNSDTVTITAWINPSGPQTALTGLIFSRTANTVAGLAIDVAGGSTALTYNWNDDSSTYNWSSGVSMVASDWNFVALVVQPNQAAIFAADYTNVTSFTGNTNPVPHAVQPFEGATLFGADLSPNGGTGPAYFSGSIDEVAIFNRALGVGEVYSQYAAAVGRVPVQIFAGPAASESQYYAGDTLSLSIDAGGTPALGYQWRLAGTPIHGATSSAYVKANAQVLADSGSYDVVITNSINSVTSAPIAITVSPLSAPAISQGPVGRTLYIGGTLDLTVQATGGQLAYQWLQNNNPIAGATGSSYIVASVATNNAGSYTVTITNGLGSISSTPPAVVTVISPAAGTFEALVAGDGPEAWWRLDESVGSTNMLDAMGRHDGTYVGNVTLGSPGVVASGGDTAATFDGSSYGTVPYSPFLNTKVFTAECWAKAVDLTSGAQLVPASSSYSSRGWWFWSAVPTFGRWSGGVFSGGTAFFVPCIVPAASMQTNVWTHLVLTLDPTKGLLIYINGEWDGQTWADFDRNTGGPFIIGAQGVSSGQPATANWKGGVDEVVFYTNSLSLQQVQAHYAAALYGNSTAPIFKQQPQSQTAAVGSQVSFQVLVDGSQPITLQWWKDNAAILNETNASLTVSNVASANAGTYKVMATNSAGFSSSSPATLTVLPPPTFANLTNSLVLHLKFDNNYTDSSVLANNGTPNGAPVFVPGHIGSNAVSVNTDIVGGLYNYVSVPPTNGLAFGTNDSFSVSLWVNYTNNPNPDDLPMIGNSVGATYQHGWVLADDTGKLVWTLGGSDSTSIIADPVGPFIADLTWHNIVVSFDRTVGLANTYIDGVQVDSRSIQGLGSLDLGTLICIGQDPTGKYDPNSNATFKGAFEIDDVGIWRRALTTYDAQSIYTVGQTGKSFDTPGVPPPTLSIAFQGGVWVIAYTGTLQSASTVNGTYANVPGAASPYTVPTSAASMQFYRASN